MITETADDGRGRRGIAWGLLMMPRWLGHASKIIFSVTILGLLAWKFDFRATLAVLSTISFTAAAAAICATLVQMFILATRLSSVVSIFKTQFRLSESFRITLESIFFSQTFVSFVGGDVLRIWRIRKLGLPLADATSTVALDRLIGIVINHVLLLASFPWLIIILPPGLPRIVLLVLAVGGLVGFSLLLLLGFLRGRLGVFRRLPARLKNTSVMVLSLEAVTVGRHLLARWRELVVAAGCSILIVGCNILVFVLLLLGMDLDLRLAITCALLVPAILEIAMLPLSIAGWGVREGATVIAFGALGVSPDRAIGASVAFGLILVAVSLLGGLLWLADRREMVAVRSEREGAASPNDQTTRPS